MEGVRGRPHGCDFSVLPLAFYWQMAECENICSRISTLWAIFAFYGRMTVKFFNESHFVLWVRAWLQLCVYNFNCIIGCFFPLGSIVIIFATFGCILCLCSLFAGSQYNMFIKWWRLFCKENVMEAKKIEQQHWKYFVWKCHRCQSVFPSIFSHTQAVFFVNNFLQGWFNAYRTIRFFIIQCVLRRIFRKEPNREIDTAYIARRENESERWMPFGVCECVPVFGKDLCK